MRAARLGACSALLALSALPALAQHAALFSRLDTDGNGYLTEHELSRAEAPPGMGWIAIDRDRDQRITPAEFFPVRREQRVPGREASVAAAPAARLQGALSARRLIGMPARDFYGEPAGLVRDILIDRRGGVTGLVVGDRRVSWVHAGIGPRSTFVEVPTAIDQSASAGASLPLPYADPLARPDEWLASEFLGGAARLAPGLGYGSVTDLIVSPWGQVQAVIVDVGPSAARRRYAYPWGEYRTGELRPFDYGELGRAGLP